MAAGPVRHDCRGSVAYRMARIHSTLAVARPRGRVIGGGLYPPGQVDLPIDVEHAAADDRVEVVEGAAPGWAEVEL